ncbi:MAG: glycoside hydrolase family 127 protein, partial [Caldilineaceae bacterium]|nr:glycoside hydrolase family 127 protein [Caldilineaceae bacterium]
DMAQAQPFTLNLRIPGWCTEWRLLLNGQRMRVEPPAMDGYLPITNTWRPGDVLELELSMPAQAVWAHPAVRQMQGRVAIQRGPIVYCVESADNAVENLDRIMLDPAQIPTFTVEYRPELLGGVNVLRGPAAIIDQAGWDDATLYRYQQPPTTQPIEVTAVPYCVWDNREPGEMRVWFRAASL